MSARRRTPDVKGLAASNPPPSLGGKAGLFAIAEPAAAVPTGSAPPRDRAEAPAVVPRRSPLRPAGPRSIPRSSELPIHRTPGAQPLPSGATVERSYVLDRDQDRMLHLISARSGRNLSDVVQEALAQLLRDSGLDQADLETLDTGPIQAGAAPAHAVRRTVTIRAEQDAILRRYRLLCQIQASDVVRQAIDHAFRSG